jgi:hypothetical protein
VDNCIIANCLGTLPSDATKEDRKKAKELAKFYLGGDNKTPDLKSQVNYTNLFSEGMFTYGNDLTIR